MASNGSLRILDTSEVVFSLAPAAPCTEAMVVLVLSAPRNTDKRQLMRARTRGEAGTRTVFLLGATEAAQQARLEAEHREHGDIVQVSGFKAVIELLHHHITPAQATVPDSYDTLSYKSLFGFLWVNLHCPRALYVTKTDDDVTLDLAKVT